MRKILLFSGGLDSVIANRYLYPDLCVHFELGTKYSIVESNTVYDFIAKKIINNGVVLHNIDLSRYEEVDSNIPLRNLFLISGAINEAVLMYPTESFFNVYLIVQQDEMSIPDRSENFFEMASSLFSLLSKKNINLYIPFDEMDKTDMVEWFLKDNWSVDELFMSYSCYRGMDIECGDCNACFRKWVSFVNNDIYEIVWKQRPYLSSTAKVYKENMNKYSKKRQDRIISAFQKTNVETL